MSIPAAPAPAPLPARLLAAAPDALTAGYFLLVWLVPRRLGEHSVNTAMLVMLIEFLVVHASGFLGAVVLAGSAARGRRLLALLGLGAFYGLFVVVFALAFGQWWPALAFFWLMAGKFSYLLGRPDATRDAGVQAALWAIPALFYILGVFLTLLLPLPRLGIDAALAQSIALPGSSGLWVEQPHRVVAFGLLYFAATAALKWRVAAGQSVPAPRLARR